jgi:hypothetical protein
VASGGFLALPTSLGAVPPYARILLEGNITLDVRKLSYEDVMMGFCRVGDYVEFWVL